jgi:hypothetical protein
MVTIMSVSVSLTDMKGGSTLCAINHVAGLLLLVAGRDDFCHARAVPTSSCSPEKLMGNIPQADLRIYGP